MNYAHESDSRNIKALVSTNSSHFVVFRFVENRRSKARSQASSHLLEFLNRVFSSDNASRFFRTYITRFMFDSNKTPDDSMRLAA